MVWIVETSNYSQEDQAHYGHDQADSQEDQARTNVAKVYPPIFCHGRQRWHRLAFGGNGAIASNLLLAHILHVGIKDRGPRGLGGQGMGLGQWDTTTDIVHWRSFIHLGELYQQNEQPMAMDHERRWFDLSPGQRMALYDRAREVVLGKRGRAA